MSDIPSKQEIPPPKQPLKFEDIDDLVTTELMRIEVTQYANKGLKLEAQMALAFSALNEILYSLRCIREEKKVILPS